MMDKSERRYPIAFCPICKRPIGYSLDPKDKLNYSVAVAPPKYSGLTQMCHKCNTMLVVSNIRYISVPVVGTITI